MFEPLLVLALVLVVLLLWFPGPSTLRSRILKLVPVPLNILPLVLLRSWILMTILMLLAVRPLRAIKATLWVRSALRNVHLVLYTISSGAKKRLSAKTSQHLFLSTNLAAVIVNAVDVLPVETTLRLRTLLLQMFSKLLLNLFLMVRKKLLRVLMESGP